MRTIIVQDGNQYFYTTSPFAASNPLGIVKATLTEYALYNVSNTEKPIGKLYKTKEGNWYDASAESTISADLATSLKMAIDQNEQAIMNLNH